MSIRAEPGARIGPYRLLSPLGAGGMGEVWRARDTELSRDVAIKLLPAEWAQDPDRLARFEIEARAVAQLNHPNVLTVYSVGREEGSPYLVTELLEGRTLRELIDGRALPPAKAIDYARQIAQGLARAHDKGIVHRDLKPANIFVTDDGGVKILDFGIARLLQPLDDADSRLETATGVMIGTAGYMAPEQVSGQHADSRADIFALGAVLFEMLTHERAFPGTSASEAITASLTRDPPSSPDIPLPMARIVRHCLEKDPNHRFQSAKDLAFHLEAVNEAQPVQPTSVSGSGSSRRALLFRWVPWILAAAGLSIAVWVAATGRRTPPRNAPPVRRFSIALADPLIASEHPPLAISPDGSRIAFVVNTGGTPALWVRHLSELTAHRVQGTEYGFAPFFSPDGQNLGFFVQDGLMRVPLAGGPPVRLTAVPPVTRGGVWAVDGWIYFSPNPSTGLARIRAEGGAYEPITMDDARQQSEGHVWPDVSSDGRFLLFTARRGDSFEESHLTVRSLITGESRVIGKGGTQARFGPADRILFARGATLFEAVFNPDALALRDLPQPILDGVQTDPTVGAAWYSVARDGSLTYVPGGARPPGRRLVWVTPSGVEAPAFPEERLYLTPAVSPDGRSVALAIEGMHQDLWRFEVGSSILTRLTSSPGEDFGPVWSPDGQRLAYTAIRHGRAPAVFVKPADRPDAERIFYANAHATFPNAWSPSGDALFATSERFDAGRRTVQLLSLGSASVEPHPFLPSRHDRYGAAVSPDGSHVAFVSLEAGEAEVFVGPMSPSGGARQVSVGGGTSPAWSRDGRRLYYRHHDALRAVDVDPKVSTNAPRVIFRGTFEEPGRPDTPRNYDVSPDGRFLMVRQTYKPEPRTVVVVLGWRGGTLETTR